MVTKRRFLEDRKIILKPIVKAGGMNPKGHDGEFMYTGTEIQFVVPFNIKKARLENPLTPEEQEYFEKVLDEDLSIHKKEKNYWTDFRIKVRKDDKLMTYGYELDLNDPIDYIRWKVLQIVPEVAPDWASRNKRGEYRFALVDSREIVEDKARKADKKKKAYMWLGSVEGSKTKMANFLRVYGMRPPEDATHDWLKSEIDKLIEQPQSLNKMLEIIEDKHFDMKLFIDDAVDAGAIVKKSRKYYLPGGDLINENDPGLDGTVEALEKYKKEGDEIYLRIVAQVNNSKK